MPRPSKALLAWLVVLTGAAMLVFALLPSIHRVQHQASASDGSAPMSTPKTVVNSGSSPQVTVSVTKPVPPSKPIWMKFPSVGLTLALGEMQAVNGVINPPSPDIGYWISNRGVMPASNAAGSVFTACHTWEDGHKPCNKLYSPTEPSKTIRPGAPIVLRTQTGTLNYVVTNVQAVSKTLVGANRVPDVKCSVPDHLVVVTCVWPDNGENFIITAALQSKKYVLANC
jgi:hypothetical protein